MITFNKIRFKNFISVGNNWIEIDLSNTARTLIVGHNGAGKSTVLDAICFALFNKAFRNINKPELVNSIIQKDMMVEVEFTTNKKEYKIRRGIKPNIFEVFVDDVLLNQPGDSRDYQEYLEKIILRMNFKSFTQIVILGSANFTPFMQLPLASRRAIIEDLLDIQVFSVMSSLLKEKASRNKENLSLVENQIEITTAKINLQNKHIEELKKNNDGLVKDVNNKILELTETIHRLDTENNILLSENEIVLKDNSSKLRKKILEVVKLKTKAEVKEKNIAKETKFYSDNDVCPTCSQDIDHKFKEKIVKKNKEASEKVENLLSELEKTHKVLLDELSIITEQELEIAKKQNTISSNQRMIKNHQKFIDELKSDIVKLSKKKEQIKKDDTLDLEFSSLTDSKTALFEEREYLSTSAVLLKDGGIKTKIIKQYIPVMNKLINHYLSQMEFFVKFEFDENFNEVIKDRTVDERSYSSFSQGEKTRIDLALLFTWRSISKIRNSTSTNIILFDEILDGPLDNSGIDDYIKILEQMTKENNIFIISHKVDQLIEKFPKVIKFEKVKGFSRVKEFT